jgi:SAM-dependent methyltransferase
MLGEDMAAYDDFAWFYNRYWNEEFHGLAFPILERIWLPRVPANGRILDVCCGTGYLAGLLSERNYRVTGVDLSAPMIEYARLNVPAAEFHVGDAAHFRASGHFDAAVSTFDSLNHIVAPADLEAVFRGVAAALRRGAPFAFDVLLEEAYQTQWGEGFALVRDDHVLTITDAGFHLRTRMASCHITMFRLLNGAWQRSDVKIQERCYTPDAIETALSRAGFGQLACYDARDLGMSGQLGLGRTFFVATKL